MGQQVKERDAQWRRHGGGQRRLPLDKAAVAYGCSRSANGIGCASPTQCYGQRELPPPPGGFQKPFGFDRTQPLAFLGQARGSKPVAAGTTNCCNGARFSRAYECVGD